MLDYNVSMAMSQLSSCQNWFQSKLEGRPNGIIRFCVIILWIYSVATPPWGYTFIIYLIIIEAKLIKVKIK